MTNYFFVGLEDYLFHTLDKVSLKQFQEEAYAIRVESSDPWKTFTVLAFLQLPQVKFLGEHLNTIHKGIKGEMQLINVLT